MAGSEKFKGKRQHQFLCGVPRQFCTGRHVGDKRSWDYGKYHGDQSSCKSCMTNYMLKMGYKKEGSNGWDPQDGGPIIVVSKKFQRVKPGKSKNNYMAQPLKVRDALPLPKNQ